MYSQVLWTEWRLITDAAGHVITGLPGAGSVAMEDARRLWLIVQYRTRRYVAAITEQLTDGVVWHLSATTAAASTSVGARIRQHPSTLPWRISPRTLP